MCFCHATLSTYSEEGEGKEEGEEDGEREGEDLFDEATLYVWGRILAHFYSLCTSKERKATTHVSVFLPEMEAEQTHSCVQCSSI